MKTVAEGTVFNGENDPLRQSCAFPGICVTASGRWICTFRAAPTKGATARQQVLLCWSDDEGLSWSSPCEPFEAPDTDEGTPGILRTGHVAALHDGRLLAVLSWIEHADPERAFFNEETEGLLDTRVCLSFSSDEGQHWTTPSFMSPRPYVVPSPTTGPIVCLANGDLICQLELNKPYFDTRPWLHQSVLVFSRDGGQTWGEQCVVSDDPSRFVFYWDQRLGQLDDDALLDVFWTFHRASGKYLNIHARRSVDGGRNWSAMWDTEVPGQPAAPVQLDHGLIAMVYVDRTAEPCIKLRTSPDDGRSWPAETEQTIFQSARRLPNPDSQSMQEAWDEMVAFSLGLPATTRLPNGDLLVVFYEGSMADRTCIRWCRLSFN